MMSLCEREHYIQKYGTHHLAFSTLAPGLQYFDLPLKGYIAYKDGKFGQAFVLGDPICAPSDAKELIASFLQYKPNANFVQASCEPTKSILTQYHGYHAS